MTEQGGFAVRQASFAYGEKKVLDTLDLSLPAGRFYGIVGPNGCGKSTLLDLLAGNRRVQAGGVRLGGKEVHGLPRRELARQIALVPQDFAIGFAFTVQEVVLMGRHPYIPRFGSPSAHDLRAVSAAMAEIGISHLADRYVNELSGGEKQRVVVARALAQEAPILLLDEATSNLDIRYTLGIFQALAERVRSLGHTVVAVIHDLDLAAAYCDEIVFMKEGRIAEHGPTAQALTPETIARVFGVEAAVSFDAFSNAHRVSFRYGARGES
ncbi:ABC transporter ATP-binding protein [Thiovibrio sp. JS02]